MGSPDEAIDRATLKRELHGEPVGGLHGFVCDYCAGPMPTGEPVCYEAIRVADMPNFEELVDPPDGWVLDASRCRRCERETLEPATDGYDEVMVMVSVADQGGVLSLDSSSLSIIDYSLDGDGYHPPPMNLNNFTDPQDYGYVRWLRKLGVFEHMDPPQDAVESIWEVLEMAADLPPELEQHRPA